MTDIEERIAIEGTQRQDVNPYGFGISTDLGRTLARYGFRVVEAVNSEMLRCEWTHGSMGTAFVISRYTCPETLQELLQYANDRFCAGCEDGKRTVRLAIKSALGLDNG